MDDGEGVEPLEPAKPLTEAERAEISAWFRIEREKRNPGKLTLFFPWRGLVDWRGRL